MKTLLVGGGRDPIVDCEEILGGRVISLRWEGVGWFLDRGVVRESRSEPSSLDLRSCWISRMSRTSMSKICNKFGLFVRKMRFVIFSRQARAIFLTLVHWPLFNSSNDLLYLYFTVAGHETNR